MTKKHFSHYVCRPFCVYFREGEKEEMSCRGAEVVEALVENKRLDLSKPPPLEKQPDIWGKYKEAFTLSLCSKCAFRADGCDFQSGEGGDDAEPCGGFILLAHLRSCGLVCERDWEHA